MRTFITFVVLSYLRFFAKLALFIHKPIIIGITGSVGKSSTRNAVYAVIKDYFPTLMVSEGNSESGIPLGILGISPKNYSFLDWLRIILLCPFKMNNIKGIKYLIIEMGIDSPNPPKNMEFLLTIAKPDISIFLNVYPVHTEQFEEDIKNNSINDKRKVIVLKIAKEKGKIITDNNKCKIAIYNYDNIFTKEIIESYKKLKITRSIRYYSFGNEINTSLSINKYDVSLKGSTFTFLFNKKTKIILNFYKFILPREYQECFASAILVGKILGLKSNEITNSLIKNFTLPKGRSSIFKGIKNSIIIDSSYNASKASTIVFIRLLKNLNSKYKKNTFFIFGDMRELGKEGKLEHEEVFVNMVGVVDYLYLIGDLTKEFILKNHKFDKEKNKFKEIKWFKKSKDAGIYLQKKLLPNSIILVKGSQNNIYTEEAVKLLLKNKEDIQKLSRQTKFWINKKLI